MFLCHFKKTLTLTNFPKFSFTASVVQIEAATKFGDVYNMDNTFFEFQENINFLYDLQNHRFVYESLEVYNLVNTFWGFKNT